MEIGGHYLAPGSQPYFIADIAANHDGDINRAKDLIYLAADAGAHAAKFQHFKASTIVSDFAFKKLGSNQSHQSKWKKSVYEVYDDASVSWEWTQELKKACDNAGITFFTTPYSLEAVDFFNQFVPAYKIGSGDITWHDLLRKVAHKDKPYILATGASSLNEVVAAVDVCTEINSQLILMQCNTNYTASIDNFKYINLNVLKTYHSLYPDCILGLSDHTPGHATVLGAIALGAVAIEKHFTDDNNREGPDHLFSMNPQSWREMVDRSTELFFSLGSTVKRVEENERDSIIVQRRSVCASVDIPVGTRINQSHVATLRPSPTGSFSPVEIDKVLGKTTTKPLTAGESFSSSHFE